MANEFSRKRVAKMTYEFASDVTLGVVGTVTPTGSDEIPSGAIITSVISNVRTAVTSANANNATIAITGGGLTLVAAQTLANQELDDTGITILKAAGNAGSSSTAPYIPQIATSTAPLKVVIAVSTLTDGKFDIWVEYYA